MVVSILGGELMGEDHNNGAGNGSGDIKQLLRSAEAEIVALREQNEQQMHHINQLMEAQEIQGVEVVELVDKVWELTEALAASQDQSVEAQMIADVLKDKLTTLRSQMDEVMKAAKENASRIQLVTSIYEMTDEEELSEEEEIIAEYSRRMKELRERLSKDKKAD